MRNNISDYRFHRFEERINEEYGKLDRRVKTLEIEKASTNRLKEIDGYTSLDTRVRMLENSDRWNRLVGNKLQTPSQGVTSTREIPVVNRRRTMETVNRYSKIDDFTKYEPLLKSSRTSEMLKRRKQDRWLYGPDSSINIPITHVSSEDKPIVNTQTDIKFDFIEFMNILLIDMINTALSQEDIDTSSGNSLYRDDAADVVATEDDFLSILRDIRCKSDKIMELLQRNARDIVECKRIATNL